jgi:hypothetical protein
MSSPQNISQIPVEEVNEDIIRQYFNKSQILDKVDSGDYSKYYKRNSHLRNPPVGEPYCTHSQILYIYNEINQLKAIIHQYERPDGTLGGSGLPDPKRLILSDRILYVKSRIPNP